MARIRRCKLSWKPADSDQIIGYRLYWSKDKSVSYDSNFFELGNVNEVYLPDVLKLDPRYGTRIFLGITALDMSGNESDIVRLETPYQAATPSAPADFSLTSMEGFSVVQPAGKSLKKIDLRIEEEAARDERESAVLKDSLP